MPRTLGQSAVRIHVSGARLIFFPLIVPTLCVGMPPWTLCVRSWDAERPGMHSHAERGNDHPTQVENNTNLLPFPLSPSGGEGWGEGVAFDLQA
ncbi:hypothetical protein E1508_06805 [Pseudomonas moraviensis]|nr:hypothetical protein E1508_06805 [Pseudomonas moraviensis]